MGGGCAGQEILVLLLSLALLTIDRERGHKQLSFV